MTFEEFFQKKKIDLRALGKERPALLEEFKKHFALMGEKSFDHTKKYWFNKLRRSYPLKEIPTAAVSTATAPSSPGKAAAGTATPPTGAPASRPAGFKPRFKAGRTTLNSPAGTPPAPGGTPAPSTATPSPPAKTSAPAATPAPSTDKSPAGQEPDKESQSPPKPAYKPRFRPGVTPPNKKDPGE